MLPYLLSITVYLTNTANAVPTESDALASDFVIEWQTRYQLELDALRSEVDYEDHMSVLPMRTRSGSLRFLGDQWVDPKWTPVYISRFEDQNTPSEIRYALLDLIARSGGDYSHGLPQLWSLEKDAKAKALMLDLVKRLETNDAKVIFSLASKETEPVILESFYRNLPRHPDLVKDDWIKAGLESNETNVLEMTIRAAGWLEIESAYPKIESQLSSEHPQIRLRSLRALERINSSKAAKSPEVGLLLNDSDVKVSRAADQIINGR